MAKFKLDETLYEPLDVEIRGKVYQVVAMDRKTLQRIGELGDRIEEKKDVDAGYQQLEIFLGQKKGTFDFLRPFDLKQILKWISDNIFRAERIQQPNAKKKEEKKTGGKG